MWTRNLQERFLVLWSRAFVMLERHESVELPRKERCITLAFAWSHHTKALDSTSHMLSAIIGNAIREIGNI
jgi:hypothetical protein